MKLIDEHELVVQAIIAAQNALMRGEGPQGAIDAAKAIVAAGAEAEKAINSHS